MDWLRKDTSTISSYLHVNHRVWKHYSIRSAAEFSCGTECTRLISDLNHAATDLCELVNELYLSINNYVINSGFCVLGLFTLSRQCSSRCVTGKFQDSFSTAFKSSVYRCNMGLSLVQIGLESLTFGSTWNCLPLENENWKCLAKSPVNLSKHFIFIGHL